MFDYLLPYALDAGVAFFDFWDMTYSEIKIVIESYLKRREREIKEQAEHNYMLAHMIGLSVGRLLDKKNKFPKIAELYPNLYKEEQIPQWQLDKERLLKYANNHNAKIKGG